MIQTRIATYRDFVGELSVNYKRTTTPQTKIKSSKDAVEFIKPYFEECMDDHEEVKILHLSRSNGVVNIDHVSKGGDTSTTVPIQNIVRNALHIKTNALIMVHNHPSGSLLASEADKRISKKLKDALALLDMSLLDSIIVTRESYTSLADNGLI